MKKSILVAAAAALMISGQAMANDLGKQTYDSACFACHATGAAGAPKFGDKAAWAPRIAKGLDVLKQHALNGFKGESGFMPAKGGRADLSDEAVMAGVDYMTSQSK
jgi:cytochrome c5